MDTDRGTQDDLQNVVTRNVRVLMAVQGIRQQQDLAARMGWRAPQLNKALNGTRRWTLEDLPVLSKAFNVPLVSLLGDTAELVGAASPHPMTGSVSRSVNAH
jgi:transcriptional regulator with XRE-family HTH domain